MDSLREAFDPDIVWIVPTSTGFGGPYQGFDAVMGFFGEVQDAWTELHVHPDEILAAGEDCGVAIGRHRGRLVNGAAVELPFVHVWTLRDGRATGFQEYTHGGIVLHALGLVSDAATV
jgi:uncharacterized protein